MKMIAEIKNEDKDFHPYRFKVSEIETKIGKKLNRDSLKTMATELRRKNLYIDKGKGSFLVTGWVSSFEYYADKGEIELCFDPKLKPYLLELQNRFAKADIRYIFQLSSEYAKRIYTIFKQWEKIGEYKIEVAEWQRILDVPKSMMIYNRFKEKIIETAKEQINEKTELEVDYKEIKTGRKVTGLEWTIKKKAGQQLTIMDVSKAQIDTEKPWVKEKRAKRAKGSEIQSKISEATGGGSVFDLYEKI
jgi:plasmid replication initiation protein